MDANVNPSQGRTPGLPPQPPAAKSSSGAIIGVGLACLALILGGVWFAKSRAGASKKAGAGARPEAAPVAVVAGSAAVKDMPVFLDGMGTVRALNLVTVRTRVDGQLRKIAFEEGQEVKKGDVLAQIDPDPLQAQLEQAKAKKGQDDAQLQNARADLKRYADLLENEGVTKQVYDTQKALVNQLEAAVKADEAAVQSAQVQLNYATITSPIDGRVGIRQVDQGNMVKESDSNGLVTIAQMRPITVVFTLPEQNLPRIQQQLNQGASLAVYAMDRDNVTPLSAGKLVVVDNQIDPATATIKLKAEFPNTDLRLWPGQYVTARLQLTTRSNSTVVPEQAIQRGPDKSVYVFVIQADQTVAVRPVKVGPVEQGEALIEEGLQPGERIVVDGQYKLQKNSRVKPVENEAGAAPASKSGKPGAANSPGENSRKTTP